MGVEVPSFEDIGTRPSYPGRSYLLSPTPGRIPLAQWRQRPPSDFVRNKTWTYAIRAPSTTMLLLA
jgi:hypothetical protein